MEHSKILPRLRIARNFDAPERSTEMKKKKKKLNRTIRLSQIIKQAIFFSSEEINQHSTRN